MTPKTKIICTLGPSVATKEKMVALIEAGMNVARINMSHSSYESHKQMINYLKEAREETGKPVAIMLDTKGPEVRIGKIREGQITLEKGQKWQLVKEDIEGDRTKCQIKPFKALRKVKKGNKILFDDGYIISHVVSTDEHSIIVEIDHGGVISSNKSVNVPEVHLDIPDLLEKDIQDILFGCEMDVDIIAASFVRGPDSILQIKNILEREGKSNTLVYAKIENSEGVENFDAIVQVADGIMIARGDLGVEVELYEVPRLQKMMIRKCYLTGIPSITATQMLESMIHNPRPTRAEASDVANAIYDSTSCVMLSGETAVGKYPIKAVKVMRDIIKEAEKDFNYRSFFKRHSQFTYHDVPHAVSKSGVSTAYSSNARAIFVFTNSGSTARLVSRMRPEMPIIALTPKKKCYHQLASNWGVYPALGRESKSYDEAYKQISQYAIYHKYVSDGDLVVVTAGTPFGVSGTTNMMVVESIGDVLVRGHLGVGQRIYGKVTKLLSSEMKKPYEVRKRILVLAKCDPSYEEHLKACLGVVLQNHIDDVESEKYLIQMAKKLGFAAITRADDATHVLKEGGLVTIDPQKSLVYKGVVL